MSNFLQLKKKNATTFGGMSGGVSSDGLSLLDLMAEKAGGDDEVTTGYDFNVVLKIVFILQ